MISKAVSQYLTETDAGYAKLMRGNFRKIRLSSEEQSLVEGDEDSPFGTINIYSPTDDDEGSDAIPPSRYHFMAGNAYEIFYSFSSQSRASANTKYGHPGWSARFLYDFLCNTFNHGVRFIDTYLQDVFPLRSVSEQLEELIKQTDEKIQERWRDGELRGGQWASFYAYQHQAVKDMSEQFKIFDREIRKDIINCLASGMIPLFFNLSQVTLEIRKRLGITSHQRFFATGWLIKQLKLHVVLNRHSAMSLYYSDSYKGVKNGDRA